MMRQLTALAQHNGGMTIFISLYLQT